MRINVKEFQFFTNNLKFIKENYTKDFIYMSNNDKNFAIYADSIFL